MIDINIFYIQNLPKYVLRIIYQREEHVRQYHINLKENVDCTSKEKESTQI